MPRSKAARQRIRDREMVERFNRDFPVGTRVLLRKDTGEEIETTVRATAFLLNGHAPVAFFTGVSGAYSIDGRVRAAAARCRVCGCTDDDCRQCIARTGEPCYWVEPDLCSACALAIEIEVAAVSTTESTES